MSDGSGVEQMMAADQASRALGIELTAHGTGTATARLTVTAQHTNGHHVGHGGVIFALADTAFAAACNSRRPTVAAAAEIVFIAPVHVGDVLTAEASERTVFGRSGIYDVTVRAEHGVVAEFRGRSHALPDRTVR